MMHDNQMANSAAATRVGYGELGSPKRELVRPPHTFASHRDRLDVLANRLTGMRAGLGEHVDRLLGGGPVSGGTKGELAGTPSGEINLFDEAISRIEWVVNEIETELCRLSNA